MDWPGFAPLFAPLGNKPTKSDAEREIAKVRGGCRHRVCMHVNRNRESPRKPEGCIFDCRVLQASCLSSCLDAASSAAFNPSQTLQCWAGDERAGRRSSRAQCDSFAQPATRTL